MYKHMIQFLDRPDLYQKTEAAFWDDEHISGEMLKAHLAPDFEGASRKLEFIQRSAAWIGEIMPPAKYPRILDVGCGPGLYTERFAKMGYGTTGMDLSRRSVQYARDSAASQGLDITYYCQNYLAMELEETFDAAVMIYCDYGVLPDHERRTLLRNLYNHLRPGGKVLLDVLSMESYRRFEELQTWETCPKGGFWKKEGYIALTGKYRCTDHVTLEQVTVIGERETKAYCLWNTYFTKEMLVREAGEAGFGVCGVLGDVAGSPCREDGPTIAILIEKQAG